MANLLQITTPVAPKNYQYSSRPLNQSDAVFDLVDLSKVIKTADRSEQSAKHQDAALKDSVGLPASSLSISKDASAAARALKALVSAETLSELAGSDNAGLVERLTELANEIMLSPDRITADLAAQEKDSTMFQGEFFDLLRQLSGSGNDSLKAAALDVLKSIVSASSGNDVLLSIAANLKWLSGELAPSQTISRQLAELSELFSSPDAMGNLNALRAQLLSLIHDVSGSLLMTDQLKNFLPLMMYNLSRLSEGNPSDSFAALLEQLPDGGFKDALINAFNEFAGSIPELSPDGQTASLEALADELGRLANSASKGISGESLSYALGKIPADGGADSLKSMLTIVLPQSAESAVGELFGAFSQTRDLNMLIGGLSRILNSIENVDAKVILAQNMNPVLENLAASAGVRYQPPTAMANLTDFLAKNIGDNALRAMQITPQSELIRGMLTAPGLYTPLNHFLIPLQLGKERAFGELWVNPDEGGGAEADGGTHLFLSFEIESTGSFELELFARGKELSVSLFCPPELSKSFSSLKDPISKIAAGKGYSIKKAAVEPLREKRDLSDVFPKIKNRRSGLNVKI